MYFFATRPVTIFNVKSTESNVKWKPNVLLQRELVQDFSDLGEK